MLWQKKILFTYLPNEEIPLDPSPFRIKVLSPPEYAFHKPIANRGHEHYRIQGPSPKFNSHSCTSSLPHTLCKQSYWTPNISMCFSNQKRRKGAGGCEFYLIIKRQTISCHLKESCLVQYLRFILPPTM